MMIKKISAVISAMLICSGIAVSAEEIQIGNGTFLLDITSDTDFS